MGRRSPFRLPQPRVPLIAGRSPRCDIQPGTNHFAHAGHPGDDAVVAAYEDRYAGLMDQVGARLADLAPPDADP